LPAAREWETCRYAVSSLHRAVHHQCAGRRGWVWTGTSPVAPADQWRDGAHGRTEPCGEGTGAVRPVALWTVQGRCRLPVRAAAATRAAGSPDPGCPPGLSRSGPIDRCAVSGARSAWLVRRTVRETLSKNEGIFGLPARIHEVGPCTCSERNSGPCRTHHATSAIDVPPERPASVVSRQ
jgi:hypothetical protein